jgi:hypothetical protein
MTKQVRIENADTGDYKLVVQVWDKGPDGEPDVLAHEHRLEYPTAMREDYVTSTRYIVVKEVE